MIISGIVKSSFVDYPKNISAVIFTAGCNFDCFYCHNRHILNQNKTSINEQDVLSFLHERKKFLDAVVISGGEPTLQKDLVDFIKKVKEMGYKVKLDTNGSNYEVVEHLIKNNLVDYVAMDIKAPFEKYEKYSGFSNVENIKRTKDLLLQNTVDYEFRTTLAPGLDKDDILKILEQIKGAKVFYIQKCNPTNSLGETNPLTAREIKNCCKMSKNFVFDLFLRGFNDF